MCGIAGFWNFRSGILADQDQIIGMCKAMTHRGPDDEGFWVNGDLALGHRRLSILDVEGGQQPWSDPSKKVWVIFNGEIYNHNLLRQEFEADGITFRSTCDTEVIPFCYLKYGENFVEHLHGMFALALWDNEKKSLYLARDRFGKKPLLYAQTTNGLVFASEMQALLRGNAVDTSLSLEAIDVYLTLGYVPNSECIFSNVKKVSPSTIIRFDKKGDVHKKSYWQISPEINQGLTHDEAREELEFILRQAVRKRLRSDVPLGAFLSGGIDSSTMVAFMQQESNQQVHTFCVGFDERGYDERKAARKVAKLLDTNHQEEVVHMDVAGILPSLQRHYGEPYGDSSAVPTYYLCQAARKHVTVAISGDGGDELFVGYKKYRRFWIRQCLSRLADVKPLGSILRDLARHRNRCRLATPLDKAWNTFIEASLPIGEQYTLLQSGFYPQERQSLYTNDFASVLTEKRSAQVLIDSFFATFRNVHPLLAGTLVDQHLYLPDDILVKVDIASMAHGLEVRCPLLDHKVVEFAATLPLSYKFRLGKGKLLLKDMARRWLPAEILHRPKHGFAMPVAEWLRLELGSFAEEILLHNNFNSKSLFQQKEIERLLKEHRCHEADHGTKIWRILCLYLWMHEFNIC